MKNRRAILFSLDVLTKSKVEREHLNTSLLAPQPEAFPLLLHALKYERLYTLLNTIVMVFNACVDQALNRKFASPNLFDISERALLNALRREPSMEETMELVCYFETDAHFEFSKRMVMYLDVMQKSGYVLGVVANIPLPLVALSKPFEGVMSYFWTIVLSSDYGALKPNETLFRSAIESLQCDEKEALIVGSNLERDILPLQNISALKVYYNNRKKLDELPEGVVTVSSLDELRTIL